ncbi:MAG: hypothetical protein M0Z43_09770 [Acidithiobacillus sp.]|nr:hypothetical protein [Acidithiobacillus sp.]
MADFQVAYSATAQNEGGYSLNPSDTGGETYKGISRKNWPKWGGWKYVDGCKGQLVAPPTYGTSGYRNWVAYLNRSLEAINALQALVQAFYRDNFWKRLGELNSQDVANFVYDKDVNTGSMGSRWLQAACGVNVDGVVGAITIATANKINPLTLLETMQDDAVAFYLHCAQKPGQAQFWKSWIGRVGLSPEKLAQANAEAKEKGIIA